MTSPKFYVSARKYELSLFAVLGMGIAALVLLMLLLVERQDHARDNRRCGVQMPEAVIEMPRALMQRNQRRAP